MICQNRGAGGGQANPPPLFRLRQPFTYQKSVQFTTKANHHTITMAAVGSRTCIHYKVTFGNQSCKEKGTLPLFETRIRTNLSTQCCILFLFLFHHWLIEVAIRNRISLYGLCSWIVSAAKIQFIKQKIEICGNYSNFLQFPNSKKNSYRRKYGICNIDEMVSPTTKSPEAHFFYSNTISNLFDQQFIPQFTSLFRSNHTNW